MSSVHFVIDAAFCVGLSLVIVPAYQVVKNLLKSKITKIKNYINHSKALKDSSNNALKILASQIINIDNNLHSIVRATDLRKEKILNDSTSLIEETFYKHLLLTEENILREVDKSEQDLKIQALELSFEIVKYIIRNEKLGHIRSNDIKLLFNS